MLRREHYALGGVSAGRESRASHRYLAGVGRYSGGITVGEMTLCFGKTGRSMTGLPNGDGVGRSAPLEQGLSRS